MKDDAHKSLKQRLAERLKVAMVAAGLPDQKDFAAKSGIPQSVISEMLSGAKWPREATIEKIETALGMPFSRLIEPDDSDSDVRALCDSAARSDPRARSLAATILSSRPETHDVVADLLALDADHIGVARTVIASMCAASRPEVQEGIGPPVRKKRRTA